MVSPKVATERMTEQTVLTGLNVETKTGPLFFIAHPLKLTHTPLTKPPYTFKCSQGIIYYMNGWAMNKL